MPRGRPPRPDTPTVAPGAVFGRLTVVREVAGQTTGVPTYRVWVCRCACGVERTARAATLRAGGTRSCGCLRSERASAAARERMRVLSEQRGMAAKRAAASRLKAEGKTLREIGAALGVTRERARQLILEDRLRPSAPDPTAAP